jgi:hypothetical protein
MSGLRAAAQLAWPGAMVASIAIAALVAADYARLRNSSKGVSRTLLGFAAALAFASVCLTLIRFAILRTS